jgi:hypothetical protein
MVFAEGSLFLQGRLLLLSFPHTQLKRGGLETLKGLLKDNLHFIRLNVLPEVSHPSFFSVQSPMLLL